MKIGQLAKMSRVSTHTIRYYEQEKLLFPESRDSNGYRVYNNKSYEELSLILNLRYLGFSIRHIKSFNAALKKETLKSCCVLLEAAKELMTGLEKTEKEIANKKNTIGALTNLCERFKAEDKKTFLYEINKLIIRN